MNTKRNWTKVTVVVVLALASLSSVAMSAPHRDRLNILAADLCNVTVVSEFDQYQAAINWAEQGGIEESLALSVNCDENGSGPTASFVDLGGDSGERWMQYMAAIEGTEQTQAVASTRLGASNLKQVELHLLASEEAFGTRRIEPAPIAERGVQSFDQYLAAIEWAERGGKVPQALTVSGAEVSPDFVASHAGDGGAGWARFEQYMAAIEGRELTLDAAPTRTVTGGGSGIAQFQSAVSASGKVRTFAPEAPTGEHDQQLFARYLASVANAGRGPTFASGADWDGPN